jgi:hypothetical protein
VEYFDYFYDKFDVVQDCIEYIKLFSENECALFREKIKEKLNTEEEKFLANKNKDDVQVPDKKLVRWNNVMFKLNKKTGVYESIDSQEKLKTVNAIVLNYLHGFA